MQIKPGDIAEVIGSVDGAAVGLTVQVISFEGHHTKYGNIWRCRSQSNIATEYGGVGKEADFAQSWLRIKKPPTFNKSSNKEKEKC